MGDSGAEESDDGWLDDCSSDDEPPVARGRSPDARKGAPSVLAGSSAGDEGTDSRGTIESPDARETPEATDGWGVEDVELPRASADDAHHDPSVGAAEADARVGFPSNAGRKRETKATSLTDAAYLDFSVKSPWERTARAVETVARAWLRLTDRELRERSTVNDSRPDHGSRDLRCLRAVVEHDQTHWRRDPYAILLYFRDDAERPNVFFRAPRDDHDDSIATPDNDDASEQRAKHVRRSCISQRAICASEDDLSPGSVGVQRWFGAGREAPFAVVEPLRANAHSSVASVSRTFADVDEATAAKAAVAVAFAAAGVPSHWPVLAPVLGPARRAFVGRTGDDDANTFGGWSVRYETDSLEGVAAERAAARTVFGLCDVLRAQLAALHGALVAETLAAEAKVTARLAFTLARNRRRRCRRKKNDAVSRGRSDATTRIEDESASSSSSSSSSSSTGGSSSESEDEDVRAGEAFLAVAGGGVPPRMKEKRTPEGADDVVGAARKKNGFKNANLRWDDDAPWAPWAAIPDPWRRVEVHATYRQVPLADLKQLKGGLSLEAAPEWTVRAVPRGAAESTSESSPGVFVTGGFFGDQSSGGAGPDAVDDGACSDDARGVAGGGARGSGGDAGGTERGLAELYYLLSRSVGTRAARDADTMGRLASAEFWDDEVATGVSPPPRAPPESVVQDVLRDIFSAEGKGGHGKGANERAFEDDAVARVFSRERNSLFPNPARSAPPDSLLSRVALHALVFGNARAVATLWRRFVREIRFAHWDRGVALPRTGGVGFEASRRRFFGARSGVPEDHHSEKKEAEDPEEAAYRDECVDVRACLVHQKIQLIDACIRRRKQKSVDEYERSDAARERRDRDARDVFFSGGWDDVGGGWDDAVGDGTDTTTFVDAVSAISSSRRTNTKEKQTKPKSVVDDDIDLVALLGAAGPAAAETSRKTQKTQPDSVVSDAIDDGFETASDGGDDEGLAVDEEDDETFGGPSRAPEGAKKTHPDGLRLLKPPHRLMRVPQTQPPPLFTEDTAREREAAMHALGDTPEGRALRVRLQSDQLVSDMSAFKAANPGSCLADFVRWHSPRDWIEEEEREETRNGDSDAKNKRPRPGKLSARMGSANNTWKTLWRDAPIVPASRQKPLFDPIREGENALEYLDTAPPPEIFAQILAAAAAAVGDAYAETFFVSSTGEDANDEFATDAPSREALTRAHAMASRVLSRACPYEAEYAAVAGELQRAERAVARSLALKKRMPGVSRELRESLLRLAAEDEARADAEHAEATEEQSSVNADAAHDPHASRTSQTPPPRPPPRAVETVLRRTHPERRGGSALAALLPREKKERKKNARGFRGIEPGADASESAAHAEYVVRVGGGHAQTHRAHAFVAPCFLRVSSAVAYQY